MCNLLFNREWSKYNKCRRYCVLDFILEYDSEATTSIHTNRCMTQHMRQNNICYTTVEVQGAAL